MIEEEHRIKEALKLHSICTIIPTYNNRDTIANVVDSVLNYCEDVIVVNDGCTDDTAEILKKYGDKIHLVFYSNNKGKGYALKQGFHNAVSLGFEYAITIDSDGQHYAKDIKQFANAIIEYPNSLIIGARNLTNVDINAKSTFANKFSNFWFFVQTGKNLSDTQTGYRLYPLKRMKGMSMITSRYEAELELLVLASWHGVDIHQIPINVYYPPQSERISHFRPKADFTRISILNTILCLLAIVYGLPLRIFYFFKKKRYCTSEFKPFTRKKGKKREFTLTIRRIIYSFSTLFIFVTGSFFILTPFTFIFKTISINKKKQKRFFHKVLYKVSQFVLRALPGMKHYTNISNEKFESPAVIICNHQSHLDLMCVMSLTPKMIFLTNNWVWNNPFYGFAIRYADFCPISRGMDYILPHLKNMVAQGYSIAVFPEGTRSYDGKIGRFHKGAFYIAEQLGIDILPIMIHGIGDVMPKKDMMLREAKVNTLIFPRINVLDTTFGSTYKERASAINKYYKSTYNSVCHKLENTEYYIPYVQYKYVYRGAMTLHISKKVLADYHNYASIIDSISEQNNVKTLWLHNSGQGEIAWLMALVNKDVEIFAFESDIVKHNIAAEGSMIPDNLHFYHTSLNNTYDLPHKAHREFIIVETENGYMLQPKPETI